MATIDQPTTSAGTIRCDLMVPAGRLWRRALVPGVCKVRARQRAALRRVERPPCRVPGSVADGAAPDRQPRYTVISISPRRSPEARTSGPLAIIHWVGWGSRAALRVQG